MRIAEKFQQIFSGLERSFYVYREGKKTYAFRGRSPTLKDYESHLSGDTGLTIVPIREDSTCLFAAIDVDEYEGVNCHKDGKPIDHDHLVNKLEESGLPYFMFTTKSGGAHLYRFFDDPIPAHIARETLKADALALGFPKNVEIFPKQTKIKEDLDFKYSGINIPYFGGTRQCWHNGVEVDLNQFMSIISMGQMFADAPPCIQGMIKEGITYNRNITYSHIIVFLKKRFPDDWKARLLYMNRHQPDPLPEDEIEATLFKSHDDRDYQYRCSEYRDSDFCRMTDCRTSEYGITDRPLKSRLSSDVREAIEQHQESQQKVPSLPSDDSPPVSVPHELPEDNDEQPVDGTDHSTSIPVQIYLIRPDNMFANVEYSTGITVKRVAVEDLFNAHKMFVAYYKQAAMPPRFFDKKEWPILVSTLLETTKTIMDEDNEYITFYEEIVKQIYTAAAATGDKSLNDSLKEGSELVAQWKDSAFHVKVKAGFFRTLLQDCGLSNFIYTRFPTWKKTMGWKRTNVAGVSGRVFQARLTGLEPPATEDEQSTIIEAAENSSNTAKEYKARQAVDTVSDIPDKVTF